LEKEYTEFVLLSFNDFDMITEKLYINDVDIIVVERIYINDVDIITESDLY